MSYQESMRAIDPNYGSEQHQRDFAARMDDLQRIQPCGTDHIHGPSCYPQDLVDDVTRRQMDGRRGL